MATLKDLEASDWNQIVQTFHNESDRGAAILAGSFMENVLRHYIKDFIRDKAVANELFSSTGPLNSFYQRIAIAHAFDLISPVQYGDLGLIRKVRNHFAHHPLDATFDTEDVKKHCRNLSMFNTASDSVEGEHSVVFNKYRTAYLFSCAVICADWHNKLLHRRLERA